MALPTWPGGANRLDNSDLDDLTYGINRALFNRDGTVVGIRLPFCADRAALKAMPRNHGSLVQHQASLILCLNGKWYRMGSAAATAYLTLHGTVENEDGDPLEGVHVTYQCNTTAIQQIFRETWTDADGNYDFGYLPVSAGGTAVMRYAKLGYFIDANANVSLTGGADNTRDITLYQGSMEIEVKSRANDAYITGADITLSRNGVVVGTAVSPGFAGGTLIDELPVYLSEKTPGTTYDLLVEADNFDDYRTTISFASIAIEGVQDNRTVTHVALMASPPFGVSGIVSVNNGFGTAPLAGALVKIGSQPAVLTAADGSYSIAGFENLSEQTVTVTGDLISTYNTTVEIDGPTTLDMTVTATEVMPFRQTDSFGFDAMIGGTQMALGYLVIFNKPGRVTAIGSKTPTRWEPPPNNDPPVGGFFYRFRIYKPGVYVPLFSGELEIATVDTYSYLTLPEPLEVLANDQLVMTVYVTPMDGYSYCNARLKAPRTLSVGATDVAQVKQYLESWGDTVPAQQPTTGKNALIDFKFKVGT